MRELLLLVVLALASTLASPACESPPPPNAVRVYRTAAQSIAIPLQGIDSLETLLARAQVAFADQQLSRFVSMRGEPLADWLALEAAADAGVFVLRTDEPFMLPAFRIGDSFEADYAGQRVTVRTVSVRPRVFELENFLGAEECEHMVERAQRSAMVDSTVGAETKASSKSQQRTSQQAWVGPGQHNDDEVFERVRKRVLELTRLDASLAEDTQLVHYKPHTHYYAHHDYSERYESNPYFAAGGNRFVTVLYYLNDVLEGGETRFPYANSSITVEDTPPRYGSSINGVHICGDDAPGLRIQPRKGRAVLFYNLIEEQRVDGVGDPSTLHVGCDPTGSAADGAKWLSNQWVRNKRVLVNGKFHLYDDVW